MKDASVPNTDLSASRICLGTALMGSAIPVDTAFGLLDTYAELGGNMIDTANVYADWLPDGAGKSEATVGKWLRERGNRDQIIVGSKGGHPLMDGKGISRMTAVEVRQDLHESLDRLQIDAVDIYWLHRDDPEQPAAVIIEMLNELMREGTIRYLGCSNWHSSRIHEANEHGLSGFIANEPWWSLAEPDLENWFDKSMITMDDTERAFHTAHNLAAVPYSSQANGFFGGLYGRGITDVDSKSAGTVMNLYYSAKNFDRLERARDLAVTRGCTANQIAIAYLLAHPFPVFPIIGCRTPGQVEEACGAAGIELSDRERDMLRREGNADPTSVCVRRLRT